jgi:hypothetical protein
MRTTDVGVPADTAGVTRRAFLQAGAGGLGALGLNLSAPAADAMTRVSGQDERAVILLLLVGGPSQLETFDPKPDAPAEVRGPFRSIATSVPGVRISEHLPKLARRMDRVTLIRSVHHADSPIHETGFQLLQTGRVGRPGEEAPHAGSVAAQVRGPRGDIPPFVVLPGPVGHTGVGISHGQGSGPLGPSFAPFFLDDDPASPRFDPLAAATRARRFLQEATGRPLGGATGNPFDLRSERPILRDAYGRNPFGQNCLLARRLVETGTRMVTVNMVSTVFHRVSWDCHGSRPFSTLDDYRRELLPTLDAAFSTLLDDLHRLGRLASTLVVAAGEFGRTPHLNAVGGRDHWPRVWSVALAGGGTRGGQVIGASDATASEPADRPVSLPELLATIHRGLGLDPGASIRLADHWSLQKLANELEEPA